MFRYGDNVSVFAYGSTGSGKTHTMQGNGTEHGLIQIKCKELFEWMARNASIYEYRVFVQMVEIYYAEINDLLKRKKYRKPVTIDVNSAGKVRFRGAER